MRTLILILGMVTVVVLAPTACTSNDQLDKPTANPPADRHDRIERTMPYITYRMSEFDVIDILGRPDFRKGSTSLNAAQGQGRTSYGGRYHAECLLYVGRTDWVLCFDNSHGQMQLVSKERS